MNILENMKVKMDSWINTKTGLGGSKDNTNGLFSTYCRLSQSQEETLYMSDDVAEKIVNTMPEEMLRKGWKYSDNSKDSNSELDSYIKEEFKRIGLDELYEEGLKLAGLHGGAGIVLGISDGQNEARPVNEERINKIEWAKVFDRYELKKAKVDNDLASKNYGKPLTYTIEGIDGEFHYSRVIVFNGAYLPKRKYKQNGYWHDSILNKVSDKIAGYSSSIQMLLSTLPEIYVNIYKVRGLSKLVAENKNDLIMKRLQMIDSKKSVFNALVIDAEGEDLKRDKLDMSDIPAILEKIEKRIATASNMPHTKLFGDGATGGLGGKGESELTEWYDQVSRKQKAVLGPRLSKAANLIVKQKASKFKETKSIFITFEELKELTKLQKADIRLKTSQADNLDINTGVLSAEEVAVSRWGSGKYNTDTELSGDARPVFEEDDE